MNSDSISIFTDGASRGNPGPGGWGAVLIFPKRKNEEKHEAGFTIQELGGKENHTTNNRMELTAAIGALSCIDLTLHPTPYILLLYTDSSYLINGITKWLESWIKNDWKTSTKKPVENKDLWQKLAALVKSKGIEWIYVAGHAGAVGNERCDEIATAFADKKKISLFNGNLADYPIKNILDINTSEKKEKKKRREGKGYSYLSLLDGVLVKHTNWAECEKRVKGKSGARFKKAMSAEEEKEIIKEWSL